MLLLNLFPGGVLQFIDVLTNGYWHAKSPEFLDLPTMNLIEWLRMPADLIFFVVGVVPMFLATATRYWGMRKERIS